MDENSKYNPTLTNNVKKLKLTKNSKINLAISIFLVTFFSIFFILNIIIHSKLEAIELKLYKNRENLFFPIIFLDKNVETLKTLRKVTDIVLKILADLEFLIIYINIIYIVLHPFFALKLIFVVNMSYFCLILLKIIIQGHRPFWDLKNKKLLDETNCMTDYASPSLFLFFIFFFYLYSIISLQKLKKKKIQLIQRIFIILIHPILIFGMLIALNSTLNEYLHQLIFTIILGYFLICLLLVRDKKIHNFIFQTLKNIYNARKYKIKTFFYVIGLIIIILISSYFIDENDLDNIKQKLKDCSDDNLFGMKESLNDIGHIFSIVGAVWGASFTLEKNISKWWGKSSNLILLIKIIIILVFNGSFVIIKIYLPKINDTELIFLLNMFINFIQNFLSFGIIPLLLDKFGLIENERKLKKNDEINNINNEDDQLILFKNSIFKEEKEKGDDGFVILDKERKKSEHCEEKEKDKYKKIVKEEIKPNQEEEVEENEFVYNKNKEENGEIYGNSNLVENVQNLEEEEEEYLYLEGIEEENNKA